MGGYDWPGDEAHWDRIRKAEQEALERKKREELASRLGYFPAMVFYRTSPGAGYRDETVSVLDAATCGVCMSVVSTYYVQEHFNSHHVYIAESCGSVHPDSDGYHSEGHYKYFEFLKKLHPDWDGWTTIPKEDKLSTDIEDWY